MGHTQLFPTLESKVFEKLGSVRLSKLRRGGSVKSTSSSISDDSESDPQDFKKRRNQRTNNNPAKTLFQNKCVQMVMLCLIGTKTKSLSHFIRIHELILYF